MNSQNIGKWLGKFIRSILVTVGSKNFVDKSLAHLSSTWSRIKRVLAFALSFTSIAFVIYLAFTGIVTAWEEADKNGLVTHHIDTPIWFKDEWLVGEFRTCQMDSRNWIDFTDVHTRRVVLYCGRSGSGYQEFEISQAQEGIYRDGTWERAKAKFHEMPVSYSGQVMEPIELPWEFKWRCQRLSESIACKHTP